MLILKIPKLYRIKKKIEYKNYNIGWNDCLKEKNKVISQLEIDHELLRNKFNDKIKQLENEKQINEIELKQKHNDNVININNEHQENIIKIKKEHQVEIDEIKIKLDDEKKNNLIEISKKDSDHKRQIEYIKIEAQSRIDEIKNIAKNDVKKANDRENEYQTLIARLKILFHEGSAKFLIASEEQESLMTDMAKTIHRKNEFVRLSQDFDEILKGHGKVIDGIKIKQIDAK